MNRGHQDSPTRLTTAQAPAAELDETAELAAYHRAVFDLATLGPETRLPLADEPFVEFWEEVERASRSRSAFAVLSERLPQLAFPIRAGISESEGYRAATRRGTPVETLPEATGLELEHPDALELVLHPSLAGRIALLVVRRRAEFVALLRALAWRNEPEPIPTAQGALMVAGFNNWSRIAGLRKRWEAAEAGTLAPTWGQELRRLQAHKELYQDRFILLSDGPYSAVPAAALGLTDEAWRALSLVIRREHECAHYLTRRLFGAMRNHLLDELIADYAGLVGATGRFRADWFLRFLGLEDYPHYRPGGRLDLYRGSPPLGEGAFRTLRHQVREAALRLESFDEARPEPERSPADTARVMIALASFRLDELAQRDAAERLERVMEALPVRIEV